MILYIRFHVAFIYIWENSIYRLSVFHNQRQGCSPLHDECIIYDYNIHSYDNVGISYLMSAFTVNGTNH